MKSLVALLSVVVLLGSTVSFAEEPPKVPEDVVKTLRYYVGEWNVEATIGDKQLKGKANFRMPRGKHCIVGSVSFGPDDELIAFSLVSGWDISTGWTTEQGSGNDGSIYTLKWRKASETVDEGELVGTLGDKKMIETDRLERKGENEYVVTCTQRKTGDESQPDMILIFHRVLRDKKEKSNK